MQNAPIVGADVGIGPYGSFQDIQLAETGM